LAEVKFYRVALLSGAEFALHAQSQWTNMNDEDDYNDYDEDQQHDSRMITRFVSYVQLFIASVQYFVVPLLRDFVYDHDRNPLVFDQRLNWEEYKNRWSRHVMFQRHLRMKPESFEKLLVYIRNELEADEHMASLRGGIIIPEICLFCTLRWLAGGSYLDIYARTGISKPSFYRVV
jgi:hypothetical protein